MVLPATICSHNTYLEIVRIRNIVQGVVQCYTYVVWCMCASRSIGKCPVMKRPMFNYIWVTLKPTHYLLGKYVSMSLYIHNDDIWYLQQFTTKGLYGCNTYHQHYICIRILLVRKICFENISLLVVEKFPCNKLMSSREVVQHCLQAQILILKLSSYVSGMAAVAHVNNH